MRDLLFPPDRRGLANLLFSGGCLFLVFPAALSAQFRTPVPGHLPDSVVKMELLLKTLVRLERANPQWTNTTTATNTRLTDKTKALCGEAVSIRVKATPELCRKIVDSLENVSERQRQSATSAQRPVLPGRTPFSHDRGAVIHYLASANVDTELGFLGDLFATASPASAYIASDVVGGLVGRSLFSMTYARVVVRDTVADTLTSAVVASDAAAMQRLLNNGGTIAARFVFPIYAGGGVTSQRAASVYPVIGFDGPLTSPDSLSFVGSLVFEYVNSLAIRSLNASSANLGTLEFTTRLGALLSDRSLLSVTGAPRRAGFAQIGVGLRQNGKLGVSALYTRTTSKDVLRPYYPRFLVSFTALTM